MQTGHIRRRSSSEEGTDSGADHRPKQRQKPSTTDHFVRSREVEGGSTTSFVRIAPPDLASTSSSHRVMASAMGHLIPTNNGSGSSNGGGPGPSSIEHSASNTVQPVRFTDKLMYEDDRDFWSERQGLADMGGEVGLEDEGVIDGASRSIEVGRMKFVKPVAGTGKRMPVDREEVVRLILQGLRDIGYK